MGSLFDFLAHIMNGAKLPNWAKLVIVLCLIAVVYIGQFAAANHVEDAQREINAAQAMQIRSAMVAIRSDIADVRMDLQDVAERDSLRARRTERKIDRANARIDDINENGTDGTNERIEELIQAIKRKK